MEKRLYDLHIIVESQLFLWQNRYSIGEDFDKRFKMKTICCSVIL